jgi:hypothetical protein
VPVYLCLVAQSLFQSIDESRQIVAHFFEACLENPEFSKLFDILIMPTTTAIQSVLNREHQGCHTVLHDDVLHVSVLNRSATNCNFSAAISAFESCVM